LRIRAAGWKEMKIKGNLWPEGKRLWLPPDKSSGYQAPRAGVALSYWHSAFSPLKHPSKPNIFDMRTGKKMDRRGHRRTQRNSGILVWLIANCYLLIAVFTPPPFPPSPARLCAKDASAAVQKGEPG